MAESHSLKEAVRSHWDARPCGTREVPTEDRRQFFDQVERERYELEPHIPAFADFPSGRGNRVLEIGVGAGTDFVNWARHGANLTGVDLTEAGVALAHERLSLEGLDADLRVADAEHLPFDDESFDIVYSYGVLHHTPDTDRAIAEALRVLKTGGGTLKLMLYHHPSLTGLLLWGYHCALQGRPWKSPRWAVYHYLESPGTRSYTLRELRLLFGGLTDLRLEVVFMGGDLLAYRPSDRYKTPLARLAWRMYPRGLIRRFGRRLGHGVLIQGRK